MESLGKKLQQEREARGLSLKDISLQTKIGLRHLEAIENDRIDLLPGGFFTRQILKTYLKSIGLEPAEWLPRLMPETVNRPKTLEASVAFSGSKEKKEISLDKVIWVTLSVIVLFLFVFLIYMSIKTTSKHSDAQKAATSGSEDSVILAISPSEQSEPQTAISEPKPENGLEIELIFNEDCWVQVFADGNLVLDGLKLEGFKTSVRAESELVINLGNAGGVSFSLNGLTGKPFGKRGAVVKNIKITRENLKQFVATEQ